MTAALAVSLGFHLFGSTPPGGGSPPGPSAGACRQEVDALRSELAQARAAGERSWQPLLDVLAAPPARSGREERARRAPGGAIASSDAGPSSAEPRRPGEVDWAFRRDILCELGRSHLQRHWQRERENITKAIRYSLGEEERVRHDEQRELDRLSATLGLDADQRAELAPRYLELRRAHLREARPLLEAQPPDYGGVLDVVTDLYAAQDELVAETLGREPAQRYAAAEAEPRTAVMAVLATLAGRPWEKVFQ